MIDEENPDRVKAAQVFAQKQQFDQQMLANLEVISRTRSGVSDTSVSPDKPKLSQEGRELAERTLSNFKRGLAVAWEHRNDKFETREDVRQFVELLGTTVSDGLLNEGQSLWRTWETKFNQTPADKIEEELDEFCAGLASRLRQNTDPVSTAAWIEQRFDSQIHALADGSGRTTKLLSGMVLARNNHHLPRYPGRDDYYREVTKTLPEWEAYYRTLFGKENS